MGVTHPSGTWAIRSQGQQRREPSQRRGNRAANAPHQVVMSDGYRSVPRGPIEGADCIWTLDNGLLKMIAETISFAARSECASS